MSKSIAMVFFSCYIILYVGSCSKKSTGPPSDNTVDTTSHDFVWQVDTIGSRSSILYDVAIIDENNIWAVGEIHTEETDRFDSLGNWIPAYNAVNWNGQEWEMIRFINSNSGNPIFPVRGILFEDPNTVWLAAGSIYKWNQNTSYSAELSYQRNIYTTEIIQKLWISQNYGIYGAGTDGLLVRYDGNSWQRLDTGITTHIQDIWGAINPDTGEEEILAVASFLNAGRSQDLLLIQNNKVSQLDTTGLPHSQRGVWFVAGKKYYVSGTRIFTKNTLTDPQWQEELNQPLVYKDRIRGNATNDVFVAGTSGLISHYNGGSWRHFSSPEIPSFFGGYSGLSVRQNLMVAVGDINADKGIILRGSRN